jgi:hypothetical protein
VFGRSSTFKASSAELIAARGRDVDHVERRLGGRGHGERGDHVRCACAWCRR